MAASKAIQKTDVPTDEDLRATTRVVESLVLRGDISALSTEDRSKFYLKLCESLGLSPASQPFAPLKLNGKEILYPTRGATDQLAAIHRLNREIVDGPRVIDLAGTKLVYAVCRATHPNGRVETSVATVPLTDPVNVLMKCETKAKRRATLSILGLGMLDESEIDSIPAAVKAPGLPVYVAPPALPASADSEGGRADDESASEPAAAMPDALATYLLDVDALESLGDCAVLWTKHRAAVGALGTDEKARAWTALVEKTEKLGKLAAGSGKVFLKSAIAKLALDHQEQGAVAARTNAPLAAPPA